MRESARWEHMPIDHDSPSLRMNVMSKENILIDMQGPRDPEMSYKRHIDFSLGLQGVKRNNQGKMF